jgi:hypothetical protein
MRITAAFASLSAATSSIAVLTENTVALYFALVLIAFVVGAIAIIAIGFLVLYVRRPADREDLRMLIDAWRAR